MTADAIDGGSPPAVSFLQHGPNVAAQSLLRDPTLRALAPAELARRLSITAGEARRGIASVTGMVARIAVHGQAALREEPRLSSAMGPFLSLDEAMARYASHRGPIVVSASPIFRPDAGRIFDEAGDTNVSDIPDPANADQNLPGQDIGPQPQQGGYAYGGGGASPEQTPQVLGGGDGGGGGGGASPLPSPAPGPVQVSPSGGIPGWVWALAAAGVLLTVAGKRRRR